MRCSPSLTFRWGTQIFIWLKHFHWETAKNVLHHQTDQFVPKKHSTFQFLTNTKKSPETVLIPKENIVIEQFKASEALQGPIFPKECKFLTRLKTNHQPQVGGKDKVKDERLSRKKEIVEKRLFNALSMFKPSQIKKQMLTFKKCMTSLMFP